MRPVLYPIPHTLRPDSFRASRRAFTLIELVIVIAIIAAASLTSFLLFYGRRNAADLTSAKQQLVAVIREAQSRSASQLKNLSWGVYFSNSTATAPFYALFSAPYSTATIVANYRLPPTVAYVTSSLALGSTSTVTFAGISGIASASTSISLYSKSSPTLASVTISIAPSGAVSF